jgi:hypothetical protein
MCARTGRCNRGIEPATGAGLRRRAPTNGNGSLSSRVASPPELEVGGYSMDGVSPRSSRKTRCTTPLVFVPANLDETVLARRDVVLRHVGVERPIGNLGDEGADRRGGDPTAPVRAADPVPDLALVVAPTPDTAHDLAVDEDRPSDRRAIVAKLRVVRDEGVPVPGRERRHLRSDGIRLMFEQDREVLERRRAQREVHDVDPTDVTEPGLEVARERGHRDPVLFVGAAGLEPATSCSQSRRATRLRYAP